jgi:mono/diheme cytochrome c family protein
MFFYTATGLFLQPTGDLSTLALTETMIPCNPINRKVTQLFFILSLFSLQKISAQDGKALFNTNCASCHSPMKDLTGPKLGGVLERDPYNGDMSKIVNWVHNVDKLLSSDPYYKGLMAKYGARMTAFPALTDKDIAAIIDYTEKAYADAQKPQTPTGGAEAVPTESRNWIIFGVISLIMAIIALILMQVNSNLKKLSDDREGILRPEPVPFYKNKVYIALLTILIFVAGGYYVTKGAIGLGRQKAYEPRQPIFYSHRVHAGIDQISCLYCHGNAWESRHAAIPSVNVCMNCHKAIQSYEKGPKLYDAAGEEINGSMEIQKLYKYAGFDPGNAAKWNPSMAKPIEWVKIHNLPDHVYFNHSQHVHAGNVQCQTCHGEITQMDEVKQFAELSMGWCINCHRETKVNFNYNDSTGNKFYSIYEKFHNDIKNHKMDSVTVKDIGGIECQRCHY